MFLLGVKGVNSRFYKLFCSLYKSFVPFAQLSCHKKLLKIWAQTVRRIAQKVWRRALNQFMKWNPVSLNFVLLKDQA